MSTSSRPAQAVRIDYGEFVERELGRLEAAVACLAVIQPVSSRWVAIKLLEEEPETTAAIAAIDRGIDVVACARDGAARIRVATGKDPALLIADRRFAWSHRIAVTVSDRAATSGSRGERIDDVLTSRWFGIPIFLGLMWVVFKLVTDVAAPFVDWTDGLVAGPISSTVGTAIGAVGLAETWFESLVIDGLIGGVGGVLVFVPVLATLYLALGVPEDSGYMARAAFLMDQVMRPIGLNGKSFLPLLLGFGCNVPGVYATRVLDRRRDRIMTSLLMPFVTCAARLPIYVLLASVFFPSIRGTVVFLMYVASIVVVRVVGAILDRVLLRDQRNQSFVLELPPYRRPSAAVLRTYVGVRIRSFLGKAGTVILGCSLIVWLLLAIPIQGGGAFAHSEIDDSAFAGVARTAAPVMQPAGLGTWEITGTLVSGFVAKEVVVATLEQVYGGADQDAAREEAAGHEYDPLGDAAASGRDLGGAMRDAVLAVPGVVGIDLGHADTEHEADIADPLRAGLNEASDGHTTLAAAAFLAFILLYVPCMATVAAIRHELGGRWAMASVGINLVAAWVAAVLVFQIGRALGLG